MQNIPNILVVGQQFPSVEIPGTHARKVTEASKRLKMLSFRTYKREVFRYHRVSIETRLYYPRLIL
jgi:hypothetical protein